MAGSSTAHRGGNSSAWAGSRLNSAPIRSLAASFSSTTKAATPLRRASWLAPPRVSVLTTSPVNWPIMRGPLTKA